MKMDVAIKPPLENMEDRDTALGSVRTLRKAVFGRPVSKLDESLAALQLTSFFLRHAKRSRKKSLANRETGGG